MADKSDSNARADSNRQKKLEAHRELDRLLAALANPDYSGSVAIEVSGDLGRFTRIKLSTNYYPK